MNKSFFIFFLAASWVFVSVWNLSCLNSKGAKVEYNMMIKLPRKEQEPCGYLYLETGNKFTVEKNHIDDSTEALTKTLAQVKKGMTVYAWNDEWPDGKHTSATKAHSKGVFAYDTSTKLGFYLVHSVPKFPDFDSNKFIPKIDDGQDIYGQSFVCLSISGDDDFNNLKAGLASTDPYMYVGELEKSTQKKAYTIYQLKSNKFKAFFKGGDANNFIYEDIIAPSYGTSFYVESWCRPCMKNTQVSSKIWVKNIMEIKIPNVDVTWEDTNDHSKWAVSEDSSAAIVCIGDMNRMTSQEPRGGSSFCIKNSNIWNAYYDIVLNIEA